MTVEEALTQLRLGPGINEDVTEDYNDAVNMAIEALEQQSIFEKPCEDCISRQTVLEYIEGSEAELGHDSENESVCQDIKELPSVTPQPKTGRWIDVKCNRCGTHAPYWAMSSTYYCSEYCPKCGAKMEKVKE